MMRIVESGVLFLGCTMVLAALFMRQSLAARDVVAGPVPAQVVEVSDGDTLRVRARIWLDQELLIWVRLDGVNSPETRGKCAREREMAQRALALVSTAVEDGRVFLHHIRYGKYAGRVLARVETSHGEDLNALLLEAGLARAYDGGKRRSWCPQEGQQKEQQEGQQEE